MVTLFKISHLPETFSWGNDELIWDKLENKRSLIFQFF